MSDYGDHTEAAAIQYIFTQVSDLNPPPILGSGN